MQKTPQRCGKKSGVMAKKGSQFCTPQCWDSRLPFLRRSGFVHTLTSVGSTGNGGGGGGGGGKVLMEAVEVVVTVTVVVAVVSFRW